MSAALLLNSAVLAGTATLLAVVLGTPVAMLLQVARPPWRRILLGGSLAVLALPGFFVAATWMRWVGFAGAWRVGTGWWTERWLPIACSAGVLALVLWPITTLFLGRAWQHIDGRLLEVTPELKGWALLRHVFWPLTLSALPQPVTITAILVMSHFAVPALFQARVWPAEVWLEFSTRFDAAGAFGKSWLPGAIAVALALAATRLHLRSPAAARQPATAALRSRLGPFTRWSLVACAAAILGVSLVLPIGQALASTRTWSELIPAASAAAPTVIRSFIYAAGTATLVCLLGILSANRNWMGVSIASLALPGIFVGILISMAATLPGMGIWRDSCLIVFTALALRYLFIGWSGAARAWRSANPRLSDVLRLAGGGAWARWRHAVWPAGGGSLRGAWFITYLLCLWDVETLILIVPPGGDSLALMIFNLLHYGHNAQVSALCVLLGLLAILPLAAGAIMSSGARWWSSRPQASPGSMALFTGASPILVVLLLALAVGAGCSPSSSSSGTRLDSKLFAGVEVIGSRGTGPGYFSKPRSVAVDGDDNLFVVDMTGRVQKFSPEGQWLLLWQMPETDIGKAKGMATAPDGGILVIEPHYHRVNHFTPEGQLIAQWGVHGTNYGQLWFPRAIAVGKEGDCFISEYGVVERVQRFRLADGSFIRSFGTPGTQPGEFNRPEGLATDHEGRVWVADSCNHRIQVFTPDGQLLRTYGKAGRAPGELSYPYDIRVDLRGNQYVCEFGNSRVQVFDSAGNSIDMLGGPGAASTQMHNPWSLCLDSRGNLYVADSGNHRVLKFIRRREMAAN